MSFRDVSLLLLLLNTIFVQLASCQAGVKKVYLLEDRAHQQWCGYKIEATWGSEKESLSALVVGTAEYRNDRLSTIALTEAGESGDWIVYDNYSLDREGRVQSLKRTTNVLPGDSSVEQVFTNRNGSMTIVSTTTRSLSTGDPKAVTPIDVPSVPILGNLQEFRFASLIVNRLAEIESAGKVCIADQR